MATRATSPLELMRIAKAEDSLQEPEGKKKKKKGSISNE